MVGRRDCLPIQHLSSMREQKRCVDSGENCVRASFRANRKSQSHCTRKKAVGWFAHCRGTEDWKEPEKLKLFRDHCLEARKEPLLSDKTNSKLAFPPAGRVTVFSSVMACE